jgi:hypothetical protein
MDYRIVIRGRLSERFVAAFGGLVAVPGDATTVLTGELVDQAQLHGILDRIRELNLELLALEACPSVDAKVAQLQQLAELQESGILTDEEFAAQKAKILAS